MPSIEYLSLMDLTPDGSNPKEHDIDALVESIRRFGFVAPIILNSATGTLLAGHGRREALIRMFTDGEDVPENILEVEKQWMVPVLTGVSFENESEVQAYLVADNRLTELGGWDTTALYSLLKGADLTGTGYGEEEIEGLKMLLGEEPPMNDELDLPDLSDAATYRVTVTFSDRDQVHDFFDCLPCTSDGYKETRVTYHYEGVMTPPEEM